MLRRLRLFGTLMVGLFVPAVAKPFLLNALGHRVHPSARFRMSLLLTNRIWAGKDTRIGRFNLVKVRRLVMREKAYLGRMNALMGNVTVWLGPNAAIGNQNIISQGLPQISRPVHLKLDTWTKITASHRVNLCESVTFGAYSTLAGVGSQIWTHGFVHEETGLGRTEVRGNVMIGSNVYIGSHSCLGAGITIADAVTVGAHASVAVSLLEPGVYVPQPLRFVARTSAQRLERLQPMPVDRALGAYRWKEGGGPPARNVPRRRDGSAS